MTNSTEFYSLSQNSENLFYDPITAENTTAILITFHPDINRLNKVLEATYSQVGTLLIVDNGSDINTVKSISDLVEKLNTSTTGNKTGLHKKARLLCLGNNLGIAAAQNHGILAAKKLNAKAVLLLDQDSIAPLGTVDALIQTYYSSIRRGLNVGAIGPTIIEERVKEVLVYGNTYFGPKRIGNRIPPEDQETAFLLASGCLIPIDVLDHVGPMNEKFFIDHVDLEWGVRARKAGYILLASAGATLSHHLGDEVIQLRIRKQPVHIHSPLRGYYLARNTVALILGSVVPFGWKLGYVIWLAKYFAFNAILIKPRLKRAGFMTRGIVDGFRGRCGNYR